MWGLPNMTGHQASLALSWVRGVLPFMLTKSRKLWVGSWDACVICVGRRVLSMVGRRPAETRLVRLSSIDGIGAGAGGGSLASIWKKSMSPSDSSPSPPSAALSSLWRCSGITPNAGGRGDLGTSSGLSSALVPWVCGDGGRFSGALVDIAERGEPGGSLICRLSSSRGSLEMSDRRRDSGVAV
jgi:hypothetical protein